MIIEYFGLPGSGKTFLKTNDISKDIRKKIDVNHVFYTFYGKIYRKLIGFLKYFQHSFKSYYLVFVDLLGKDFCKTNSSAFNDLLFIIHMYKTKSNKKICYADEGIVQSICFLLKKVPENFLVTVLKELNITNIKFIYVSTRVDKCISNIRSRNRHVCSFDEMDDEKLRSLLYEKDELFKGIYHSLETNGSIIERR